MSLSNIRNRVPETTGALSAPEEGDFSAYEVFIQLRRGDRHLHAGSVDAPDDEIALQFAREHYGQDQECVNMWVVPRSAIIATNYQTDLIWRYTDQGYRLARGYAAEVRRKWAQFRESKDIDKYQAEDLKESF